MTRHWREAVPRNRLANQVVYDEWLAKPSWTVPESVFLILGLDPSSIGHTWERRFPGEEYDKVADTLRRAVGVGGKQGLAPIYGVDDDDWLFEPHAVIKTAVHYKLEVSELLCNRAKVDRKPADTLHGNAARYAKQREDILMAGFAALAYQPDEFRTKTGRLVNKKLAEYLEDFWPGDGAPQRAEAMAQLFGEVLKFGKWTDK